jgi:hypothetical protein
MPSLPTADRTPLSREEIARIEVGHTDVAPAVRRFLVAAFLVAIATMPLVETIGGRRAGEASVWRHLLNLPSAVGTGAADPPTPSGPRRTSSEGPWRSTVAVNRSLLAGFDAFESALEQESVVGRVLRPPTQLAMSGWLGAGNERVYVGRDGWLFYRPDVEYATGAAFLSPRQQARRVRAASEWQAPPQPDPLQAIRALKLDLDARGIALVVVPTPVKPTVQPAELASAYAGYDAPVQNPSFAPLVDALRRDGILVFDPAPTLVAARTRTGEPQYLRTDTHWRPEAVQAVAEALSTFLAREAGWPPGAQAYTLEPHVLRHAGDTLQMLDLPATQTHYPLEEVTAARVRSVDGTPWRPTRGAEVLVLGDSFSNIYALDSMGWGEGAGFVEHLSAALRRPADRLVQNDEGAFATRLMLQRAAATDPDRLTNTRVVVYQFATRELAQGDWRVLPLPR